MDLIRSYATTEAHNWSHNQMTKNHLHDLKCIQTYPLCEFKSWLLMQIIGINNHDYVFPMESVKAWEGGKILPSPSKFFDLALGAAMMAKKWKTMVETF